MQPSLDQPPMSGDANANPLPAALPPLSPELPAHDTEPAQPITDTPPAGHADAGAILLPKALVDDLYREARKNFALIPDMTFALLAGARAVRDTWEHKDGKFLRKEKPFANYVPPADEEGTQSLLGTTNAPATPEPERTPADLGHGQIGLTNDGEMVQHSHISARSQSASEDSEADLGSRSFVDADWTEGESQADRRDIHPDDPNAGMERIKRAKRVFRNMFEPANGRKHWVDPSDEAGWGDSAVDETVRESGGRPVTPELLQIFSQDAYRRRDRGRVWRTAPFRPGMQAKGWEQVAEFDKDGYYGFGVYDPDTNTLVVANSGTDPTEFDDLGADFNILSGDQTQQALHARELFFRSWQAAAAKARAQGKPPPRVILTGHSLGGALAQFQLATVFAIKALRESVDIRVVTFAGLGAQESIYASFPQWVPRPSAAAFDAYANKRVLNYVRRGDGLVNGRLGRRPRRLGRDVWLAGIDMDRAFALEAKWRQSAHPEAAPDLLRLYLENHALRSYYHPDFTDPLDVVFSRRIGR